MPVISAIDYGRRIVSLNGALTIGRLATIIQCLLVLSELSALGQFDAQRSPSDTRVRSQQVNILCRLNGKKRGCALSPDRTLLTRCFLATEIQAWIPCDLTPSNGSVRTQRTSSISCRILPGISVFSFSTHWYWISSKWLKSGSSAEF